MQPHYSIYIHTLSHTWLKTMNPSCWHIILYFTVNNSYYTLYYCVIIYFIFILFLYVNSFRPLCIAWSRQRDETALNDECTRWCHSVGKSGYNDQLRYPQAVYTTPLLKQCIHSTKLHSCRYSHTPCV